VERSIRYVRDAFFAARAFVDLDDLNAQADAWCRGQAADRRCPEDQTRSVAEVFAEEAPMLLKQPDNPYPVVERVAVKVGKTPYVRFDLNEYTVPHTHVQRTLTVLADPDRLRIVEGQAIVASHPRSYDKGEPIEDPPSSGIPPASQAEPWPASPISRHGSTGNVRPAATARPIA
jgi:hypothetical protein